MGSVMLNRFFDHDGVSVVSPSLASMSRSTSISRVVATCMPVVEELPLHTPA